MKKVLLWAYYYPPLGGSGVHRSFYLFNEIAKDNYVHIITVKNIKYYNYDETLLKRIEGSIRITRLNSFDVPRLLYIMGKKTKKAENYKQTASIVSKIVHACTRNRLVTGLYWLIVSIIIIRKEKIRNMVVTGPPFGFFISVALIKYLIKDINLILDYRDPWTNDPNILMKRSQIKFYNFLEKYSLEKADKILVFSDKFRLYIHKKYHVAFKKPITIENGYPEDVIYNPPNSYHIFDEILYAGILYERQWDLFKKAVLFINNSKIINVVGYLEGKIKYELKKLSNKYKIRIREYMPNDDLIKYSQHFKYFLVLIPNYDKSMITAKIFSYMGIIKLNKTLKNEDCFIIGFVPEDGDFYQMFKNKPHIINNPKKLDDLSDIGILDEKSTKWMDKYSRKEQAKIINDLLI